MRVSAIDNKSKYKNQTEYIIVSSQNQNLATKNNIFISISVSKQTSWTTLAVYYHIKKRHATLLTAYHHVGENEDAQRRLSWDLWQVLRRFVVWPLRVQYYELMHLYHPIPVHCRRHRYSCHLQHWLQTVESCHQRRQIDNSVSITSLRNRYQPRHLTSRNHND